MFKFSLFALTACLLCSPSLRAQSPEAQAILDTFELHPDFKIELIAMEPVIFDPVDLRFDEAGRAFVMEFPGYPYPEVPGRIVELIDNDGDGFYETRSVYAEDFPVADSLLPYHGGFLVASPPDLVFVKDTTGDGKADFREIVATGFDVGNQQHNFNGLTYGLDNWIYGACGGNGGRITFPGKDDAPVDLRWQDFRIDVPNKVFETIGRSSGGFGLAFNDWGHLFETHNTQHLLQHAFHGRYLDGVPAGREGTLADIYDRDKNGLVRIYPIGEQVSRVNHPQQSGFFSGACGITCYTGGSFPEEFDNNIFVADVVLNLVHRDRLVEDGPLFKGERVREKVEFLASTDRSFRPVNMAVGPDGALYLLDMHRDVIEHPEWIPDELEKDLDLNAGKDKGRIFRISPKSGLPRVTPHFDRGNLASAVAALDHKNKWWRDTAQRLLVQWQDPATPALLAEQLKSNLTPQGRIHSLWTLEGHSALSSGYLLSALADDHPAVRENAVAIAEPRIGSESVLRESIHFLINDSHPRVRMRAALALSTLDRSHFDAVIPVVMERFRHDSEYAWLRKAYLCAVKASPYDALDYAMGAPEAWSTPQGQEFVASLAEMSGRTADADQLQTLLLALANTGAVPPGLIAAILEGVTNGAVGRTDLQGGALITPDTEAALAHLGASSELNVIRGVWHLATRLGWTPPASMYEYLELAQGWAADPGLATDQRVAALEVARFAPFAQREELLFTLLEVKQPQQLQRAAIGQLSAEGSQAVASRLLRLWDELGPETRYAAGNILLHKSHNHDLLLTALETERINIGQLNMDLERRRTLLFASDESTRERAGKLFSDAGVVTRAAAIDAMRPALEEPGDPDRGHAVYAEHCARCHQIGNEGVNVGPNLTEIFRKSRETLLYDILDPNAAVDNEYVGYTVELDTDDVLADQTVLSGLIVHETGDEIVLVEPGGAEHTFRRDAIKSLRSNGLSLMPEELEKGLTITQMADLLAFLQLPR